MKKGMDPMTAPDHDIQLGTLYGKRSLHYRKRAESREKHIAGEWRMP